MSIFDRPRGRRPRPSAGEATDLPMVTILAIVSCVAFYWAHLQKSPDGLPNGFEKLWSQSPFDVWEGGYWTLITSTLVHYEFIHIAFNLYWIWFLGAAMERAIGSAKFFVFYVAAAFVSSSYQLSLDGPGIGASGVNYALFGFMWASRFHFTPFLDIITERTSRLLFGWLFICLLIDWAGLIPIGNVAHFSGFIFGCGVGGIAILRYKLPITVPAFALFLVMSVVILFWSPWSMQWSVMKALEAQMAGRNEEALIHYNRIIRRNPSNFRAYYNRSILLREMGMNAESATDLERALQLETGAGDSRE